jgi:[ribosomal protein S18]-alanine N-acetyltransferase
MTPPIRLATSADIPYIVGIERASSTTAHWPEADYTKALTEITSPRRILLVAECNAQVQGFLVARSAHPSEWEIENVVVAEPARRTGLGTALLQAFVNLARAQNMAGTNHEAIFLEVRESNLAARQLYEKFGFLLDARRSGYYSSPAEDAILYHM